MFEGNIYKKIYKKIKEYDTIVIARHIGPDPDALGSSLALKDIILNTFPHKHVYVIGVSASKFKYLGSLDKITDVDTKSALLIVTDTPDKKRIDGANPDDYAYSIKIDHHPLVDKMCDIEYIDPSASSASQLVLEVVYHTTLKLTPEAAKKLYIGIVADTNRFLYFYTTPRTFELVSHMIADTDIDITSLYPRLYMESLIDKKFEGYVLEHFKVTDNGLAYLLIPEEVLTKYHVDAATARNMVNNYNYINEILVWAIFTPEKATNSIRGSLRSRGPVINKIAARYNGGGHIFACGAHVNSEEEIEKMAKELDEVCIEYRKEHKDE